MKANNDMKIRRARCKMGPPNTAKGVQVHIRLTLSAAAFAAAFSVLPAWADDIPTLHVEQVCHGIVNQSGDSLTAGDPKVAFSQCMDAEQADRDALSKEWSTFNADDKKHCTDESRMGGDSSYTELITCLEMARDVRSLRAGSGLTKLPQSSTGQPK